MPSLVLGKGVVRIAIQPTFTVLGRGDHRMATALGVFAGVPVRRGVTTPRAATGLTRSQMHPPGSYPLAVLTHARSRRRDCLDGLDMRASGALSSHSMPPFSSIPPTKHAQDLALTQRHAGSVQRDRPPDLFGESRLAHVWTDDDSRRQEPPRGGRCRHSGLRQ